MSRFYLPDDPLPRFLTLDRALGLRFSWWHGRSSLRVAALSLVTTEGRPEALVGELGAMADRLKRSSGWTGPFQGATRFLVAAILLRNDDDVDAFFAEYQRARPLCREEKLPRSPTYQGIATVLWREQAQRQGWRVIRRSQIERTGAIWREMKLHHPWITSGDDLPFAALLSSSEDSPKRLGSRFENIYQGLRAYRFSRGNALQAVSHLLYLHPQNDDRVLRRFRDLYQGFRQQGLWMYEGDYDEVAVLTFLPQSVSEITAEVLRQRPDLGGLRPRPGRNESFSLACHTAFLTLAGRSLDNAQFLDAAAISRLVAVIQAQQAAAAAAAAAGASAAAASS